MTLIGVVVSQDCRWIYRIAGQPETTTPPLVEVAFSGASVILDVEASTAPRLPDSISLRKVRLSARQGRVMKEASGKSDSGCVATTT